MLARDFRRACHSTNLRNLDKVSSAYWFADPQTSCEIEHYREGSRIRWPSKPGNSGAIDGCTDRSSQSQSVRSRLNCAFAFGNAETDWLCMVLLSYRAGSAPTDWTTLRDHRNRFVDSLRKRWRGVHFGWFLEFTEAGTPHFHVFLGNGGDLGAEIAGAPRRTVRRKGKETVLVGGAIEDCIVKWWSNIVGDVSPEFQAFQNGGIVEAMRSPDAAGRYAAKEASKAVQKQSPFPVKQWWGMSRNCSPRVRETTTKTLQELSDSRLPGVVSRVWDSSILREKG